MIKRPQISFVSTVSRFGANESAAPKRRYQAKRMKERRQNLDNTDRWDNEEDREENNNNDGNEL